jgi:hypothetical protein
MSYVKTYLLTKVFFNSYLLEYKKKIVLKTLHFTLLEGNLHYLH